MSLKRLRAMHGVKESLVCGNCSKRETCAVANLTPEDFDPSTWKSGVSDLLTVLYYFSMEVEAKQGNEAEKAQELLQ